ncbi:hypothetical protein ACK2IE_15210 [Clostridioides difficile]|nr:hypothetical protein [Clostridioides difficile]MDB9636251.1 hypothetical protein [Clostridioides difficile]WKK93594.1 hypothetical protein Q0Y04_04515 [Clostridioides difficile]WPV47511.1 hypothetical protein CDIFB12_06470 [Clostridioides difficile]
MRLNVTKQNTIEVENSRKEDVYFVIVDNVFLNVKVMYLIVSRIII